MSAIINETTTRDIADWLDEQELSYYKHDGYIAQQTPITIGKLLVYWDDNDRTCQGWAWRYAGPDGHESGSLDSFDELADLIEVAYS